MPPSESYPARYRAPSLKRTVSVWLAVFVAVVTAFELLFGGGESPAPMGTDVVRQEQPSTKPVAEPEPPKPVATRPAEMPKESPELKPIEEQPATKSDGTGKPTTFAEADRKDVSAVDKEPPVESEPPAESAPPATSVPKDEEPKETDARPTSIPLIKLTEAQEISPAKEPTAAAADAEAASKADAEPDVLEAKHVAVTLRGRVVWLNEMLRRRYSIATADDASEQMLALESDNGTIHPIVEDTRGRAFRLDERLRDRPVEVLARRYLGSPMIQVIRLYVIREDGRYELDYWCDICAIQMFQHGVCDCCQGDNRLRERKVEGE